MLLLLGGGATCAVLLAVSVWVRLIHRLNHALNMFEYPLYEGPKDGHLCWSCNQNGASTALDLCETCHGGLVPKSL